MSKPLRLTETLHEASVHGHVVEFFDRSEELAMKVADFVEPSLRGDEAVVLIAVPEHLNLFRKVLDKRQLPIQDLLESGRLQMSAAQNALMEFTTEGQVQWARFESTIGATVVNLAQKYGKVRIYGEMVNILWQKGLIKSALELEGFWNRLRTRCSFSLFCAYSLDILDPLNYPTVISSICRTHSHSFADSLDRSFESVMQRAINEVLQPEALALLQHVLNKEASYGGLQLSASLKALLWLDEQMPQIAHQVLAHAREFYKGYRGVPAHSAS